MFISYSYFRFSELVYLCSSCLSVTLSLFVFVILCVFVSHPCCETKRHWRPFPWPLPWWEASLVHQEAQALSQGMFSKISKKIQNISLGHVKYQPLGYSKMNKMYHWLTQNISPGGKPDLSQSTTFSQNIQIYLKYIISIQSALLGGIIRSPRGTHSPTCYRGIFQNIQNISPVYTKYWLKQWNRRHHWFARWHPISLSHQDIPKHIIGMTK